MLGMSPSMDTGWGPQFRGADQDIQSSRTTHSTHPWIQHGFSLGDVTSGFFGCFCVCFFGFLCVCVCVVFVLFWLFFKKHFLLIVY